MRMDCSRTKELLSEYIDGLPDKELEAEVRDHLLQCGGCRNELEAMKAVVREIGSLEKVKAPDSFLADLHVRMEKDSWFLKIKKFLSMPARFGIPVELATLATTVVLAFFIFHIVQMMPLKGPADLKDKKAESEIGSGDSEPVSGSGMRASEQGVKTDKIMSAPLKKQKIDAVKAMPSTPLELPTAVTSKAAEQDQMSGYRAVGKMTAPAKVIEPIKMVLLLKPAGGIMALSSESREDVQKPAEKAARMPAPVRLQARTKAGAAEVKQRDEALSGEKSYEEEKPPVYQERLLPDIEESVKNAGGTLLKTDINMETNQPEYLLIQIPGRDYPKLAEKLAQFGQVQTPSAEDATRYNEPVQVRLQIVTTGSGIPFPQK